MHGLDAVWTFEDFLEGTCSREQIGTKRPPPEVEITSIDLPLTDTLEADIRSAYAQLGGLQYLLRNPALLNKMLLRQAPAAAERRTLTIEDRRHMEMRFEMSRREQPWVSPKRLAYQGELDESVATDIDMVTGSGPFYRQPAFVEAHAEYLAGKTAAEPPSPAAQATSRDPKGVDSPEPPTPLRASAAAGEKRDVRRDNGPRGNAKHR